MELPLFDTPSSIVAPPPAKSRRRHVAVTSRLAYDALKPKLPRREAFVLEGLKRHNEKAGRYLTSGELFDALNREFPDLKLDVNSIRPRLSGMSKTKDVDGKVRRAYVAKVKQRMCGYKKSTAWTWRLL